jgi:S1-C subfamily serine protease
MQNSSRIGFIAVPRCTWFFLAIAVLSSCTAPTLPPPSPRQLDQPKSSLAAIFKLTQHSVLSIKANKSSRLTGETTADTMASLRDLCGHNVESCLDAMNEAQISTTSGTGFFIRSDGLTLTAAHVVEGAEKIYLRMANFEVIAAKVIGIDPKNDLALLLPNTPVNVSAVAIGDSRDMAIGDPVISIGSPFGLIGTLTMGHLSGKDRLPSDTDEIVYLQSDVVVNPGNSGGPIFDERARAIGMTSKTLSTSGEYSGVSFAIPIELAMLVVDDLLAGRALTRGRLGASFSDIPPEMMELVDISDALGVLVVSVVHQGSFDRHEIKPGDIVRSVNAQKVLHSGQMLALLFAIPLNQPADLEIWRAGKTLRKRFSY